LNTVARRFAATPVLASDEAIYINGAEIEVYGGMAV